MKFGKIFLNLKLFRSIHKQTENIISFRDYSQKFFNVQGDSGGPLVKDDRVIGIVSFGTVDCPSIFPEVFTMVGPYKNWIHQVINQTNVLPEQGVLSSNPKTLPPSNPSKQPKNYFRRIFPLFRNVRGRFSNFIRNQFQNRFFFNPNQLRDSRSTIAE